MKRQRTGLDLRGSHYCSARALATIAREIRLHGLPASTSRTSLGRQRRATLAFDTPFGPIIQIKECAGNDGEVIRLPFQHPLAMLWAVCQQCPAFAILFASILSGQRLKIVEYTDEIVPGRELIKNNDKKIWILYWSFLDFGPAALSNETGWFTGVVDFYLDVIVTFFEHLTQHHNIVCFVLLHVKYDFAISNQTS